MADFLFCPTCGYDTPHWKARNGSWFTWTCSVCNERSDDTPAKKEQREAVKREHDQQAALVTAQLTDLGNQVQRLRMALAKVETIALRSNALEMDEIKAICAEALR
jgi:uncharacterized Zn finger protein (UPF0148 family)